MSLPNEYCDFEAFLSKLLKQLKEQDSKVDVWLGATSSAIGTQAMMRLLPKIGLGAGGAGLAGGILGGALFPIVGAAVGAGVGIAIAKYLNKADSEEGREISENLQAAKALFEEYASSTISDAKKKMLIDDLFSKLISGEKIF